VAAKLNGVFIDRFHSVMERDEVLRQDFVYFEEKPLVMKICCVGQCVETNEIAKILVWVEFPELILRFGVRRELIRSPAWLEDFYL